MKINKLFNIMNSLKLSVDDLQNTFDSFEVFIGHYGMEGKGADEVEKEIRKVAKKEIRGYLLSIVNGAGAIITQASNLQNASMDTDYKEYL